MKKEDRKMAFSTDFRLLLVPSLDDKELPFVASVSRFNFESENVYVGPFSSINCVAFNYVFFKVNDLLH